MSSKTRDGYQWCHPIGGHQWGLVWGAPLSWPYKVMLVHSIVNEVMIYLIRVPGSRNHPPPLPNQTATAADGMHPTGMHSC